MHVNRKYRGICPIGELRPHIIKLVSQKSAISNYTDILKFRVFPSQQTLSKKKKLQNVEVEREEIGQGARLFVSIHWEPYCRIAHTCGHFLKLCNIKASQICPVRMAAC